MAPPTFDQRGNVMYYAALGDISGAPHEFNRFNTDKYDYEFIQEEHTNPYPKSQYYQQPYKNRCSDDTILSMAVAKAIMEVGDDLDKLEKATTKYLKEYARRYPNDGITFPGLYGTKFIDWANSPGFDSMTGRPSFGNGSAMRVSAVGWAYNSLEKTLEAAKKTALPSHGHAEGIKGAQAIASAIYLARAGVSMADIKAYLETKFDYDLDIPYEKYQYYNKNELKSQSEFCQTTVPMAICAFLNSTDENGKGYEDCVRKAVNICGDSDTIGAMAGSIAGAFYGMTKEHETKCESLLNDHLNGVAKEFQQFVASRHTEPDKAELEAALAKARLESYLLQQAKAGTQTPPSQDTKVLELLAKSEAARLFHEQVKAARQKNDKDLEQKLLDKREDIVKALAKKCEEWPDLQSEYHVLEAWPVKQVKVVDVDEMTGRRKPNVPKTLPQQRAVVNHQAVAKLSVTRRIVIDEVLATKIGKFPEMPVKPKRAFLLFRPFRYLYHKIKGDYKPFSEKMAEYTEDYTRAKELTDKLKREKEFLAHGKEDRENSEAERRRAYDEQLQGVNSYNAEVDMKPKFIPTPELDEAPKVPQPPEMPKVGEPKAKEEKSALENDQKAAEIRTLKQKSETLEKTEATAATEKAESTLVNDQKAAEIRTLKQKTETLEKTEATAATEKAESTLVNDQKAEEIRTLKQKTETLEKTEATAATEKADSGAAKGQIGKPHRDQHFEKKPAAVSVEEGRANAQRIRDNETELLIDNLQNAYDVPREVIEAGLNAIAENKISTEKAVEFESNVAEATNNEPQVNGI